MPVNFVLVSFSLLLLQEVGGIGWVKQKLKSVVMMHVVIMVEDRHTAKINVIQ